MINFGFGDAPGLTVQQVQDMIPKPAVAAPPGVADESAKGSAVGNYAVEDHTHQSSVQATIINIATGATGTWTYAKPFANGVKPVISCDVESADPNYPITVNFYNVTNIGLSFKVFKSQAVQGLTLANLVGAVVNVFGGTVPPDTKVHFWARMPTTT